MKEQYSVPLRYKAAQREGRTTEKGNIAEPTGQTTSTGGACQASSRAEDTRKYKEIQRIKQKWRTIVQRDRTVTGGKQHNQWTPKKDKPYSDSVLVGRFQIYNNRPAIGNENLTTL